MTATQGGRIVEPGWAFRSRAIRSVRGLGFIMREAAAGLGLSTYGVAEASGMPQANVQRLLSGNAGISAGTLFKLVDALGFDLVIVPRDKTMADTAPCCGHARGAHGSAGCRHTEGRRKCRCTERVEP